MSICWVTVGLRPQVRELFSPDNTRQSDGFVTAGISADANRELLVDLQRRQLEKRLTEDDQDHLITKSNSQVDQRQRPAVEDEDDLLNVQSEGLEQPGEGGGVASINRSKSLSEMERREFFPRPQIVSFIEDTDERDGYSLKKIVKTNPEMNSKLCSSVLYRTTIYVSLKLIKILHMPRFKVT